MSSNIIVFLLLFIVNDSFTQGNRYTEEEINIQKVFIEAGREKILGKYEKAAFLYEEVLKQDKNNAAASYELARVYDALDSDEKALKYIKIAASEDKNNPWYQLFLADMYEKIQSFEEAAKIYEKLVKNDPSREYYYHQWAYFLVQSGKTTKAIKVLDDLEKKIGVSETIVQQKHTLYDGIGKPEKAIAELQKLVNTYTEYTEYHHLLAAYYTRIGKTLEAEKVYKQIIQIDPYDTKAMRILAGSREISTKNTDEDIEALQPLFEDDNKAIDVKIAELFPYINKIVKTNDQELATALLDLGKTLTLVHPEEAKAHSVYGDLLNYAGQEDEALQSYLKTLQLNNTVYSVWEQIMRIYDKQHQYSTLADFSEQTIDLFPNQPLSYYMYAFANFKQLKIDKVLPNLQMALMVGGKKNLLTPDIYSLMGQIYCLMDNFEKANKAFEDALTYDAKNPLILSRYSYTLAKQEGRLAEAKEKASFALKVLPEDPEVNAANCWVAYQEKEYQKAKSFFEKAIGDENILPLYFEHYGDILFKLGEPEMALQYWQKAWDKGLETKELERKIKDKKLYD